MASKSKQPNRQPDHITVKYVKKAAQWVRTICKDGRFTREWFMEKPDVQ